MNGVLAWDTTALQWVNSHHNPLLDAILMPVSMLGEVGILWAVICLALVISGRPGYRQTALLLFLTVVVADRLLAPMMAGWFPRQRPYMALEGIRQWGIRWGGTSFPSGHAHCVWIATIILGSRWKRMLPALIAFAVLTCYSRPYLGMHYPGDVLAGSILGLAAAFAALGIERAVVSYRRSRMVTAELPNGVAPAQADASGERPA